MGKINYKTCPVCGKNYPHNRKFFKRHKDETLHDICKYCEGILKTLKIKQNSDAMDDV